MKKSHLVKVYRAAAESMSTRNRFSCDAVYEVYLRSGNYIASKPMEPCNLYRNVMLNGQRYPFKDEEFNKCRSIRVLLLLMMAEWVKTDYDERGAS